LLGWRELSNLDRFEVSSLISLVIRIIAASFCCDPLETLGWFELYDEPCFLQFLVVLSRVAPRVCELLLADLSRKELTFDCCLLTSTSYLISLDVLTWLLVGVNIYVSIGLFLCGGITPPPAVPSLTRGPCSCCCKLPAFFTNS
jgi:hypothetical protein